MHKLNTFLLKSHAIETIGPMGANNAKIHPFPLRFVDHI